MPELGESLSDREIDVLQELVNGASNKQIADDLSISPFTVKTHLRNIYTKLGVSTRTEASTVALQQGILTLPGAELIAPAPDSPGATTLQDTSVDEAEDAGAASQPGGHLWRNLSLALGALLLVVLGIALFSRWQSGQAAGDTATPFPEAPLVETDTRWLASRPLPQPLATQAIAAVGLDVYLIGGDTLEGVTGDVSVFDTQSRTWRQAASKPTAVADADAAELFGEIYVTGGRLVTGEPTSVVEAYSPSQNAWRRVASLPEPLAGAVTLSDGSFLYVFGGANGEAVQDSGYVYDPGADTWRPVAPLPEARAFAAGDALTGRLYVVGGFDGEADRASCFAYDPAADAWVDCPDLLQPRSGAAATVLFNKLYLFGGGVAAGMIHGEIYDPASEVWQVLNMPPGLESWAQPAVTRVENRIYVQGGRKAAELSDANLVYAPFVFQTYIPAASSDVEE